jgi:hypothetical protein
MKDILPELNGKDYIEKLKEEYEIRFCKIEEVDQLVGFINKYWKENHIFVLSKELLDWQHLDRHNKRYNFVIAKNKERQEIHSILGFVPTSQYDNKIKRLEVWPCIWKSRDDIHVKGLGVALYHYLKENLPIETISILGISKIALSIYKHWNFQCGKIDHFYMLNPNIKEYRLVGNYEEAVKIGEVESDFDMNIQECDETVLLNLPEYLIESISPYKSIQYYVNRFTKHPIYKYKIYKVEKKGILQGIILTRICEAYDKKAIRIVDYIGNIAAISGGKNALLEILALEDAEYMDFINVGLDKEVLKSTGFLDKNDSDVIVPNYYEPFYMENENLDYAFKTVVSDIEVVFYKADADQDRPNQL